MTTATSTKGVAATKKAGPSAESTVSRETVTEDISMKDTKETYETFWKGYEAAAEQGKDVVGAFAESSRAAVEGLEALGTEATSLARAQVEGSVGAAGKIVASRNVQDMLAVQAEAGRELLDAWATGGTRTTELVIKTFNRSVEPFARYAGTTVSRLWRN